MKPAKITPGLKEVLPIYCKYRGWKDVAPDTIEKIRELIIRAGTVEDCIEGLKFFFESSSVEDYIVNLRPNIPINYLLKCWDLFIIYQEENKSRSFIVKNKPINEYAAVR